MRSKIIIFFAVAACAAALAGCGGPAATNSNVGNTAAGNSNNPLETTKTAPAGPTNNAPTLTPVFAAYCDAWVKKDEAALRKVYSLDTIKDFESQMKDEKIKGLVKFLEDDAITGKVCSVRNEQITGDTAVAEIIAEPYPNGIKVVFVKENGEWKLTNRSPVLDSIKQSASNSNTGK